MNIRIIHPLWTFTVGLILGIICPENMSLVFFIASITALLLLYHLHVRVYAYVLLISLFLGLTLGIFRINQLEKNRNVWLQRLHNKPVHVIGRIQSIEIIEQKIFTYSVDISVEHIHFTSDNKNHTCHETIRCYLPYCPSIQIGDKIELKNIKLKKPRKQSYERYLKKEGILASVFLTKLDYALLYRPTLSIARWFSSKKYQILKQFSSKLNPQSFALFSSLFLGNKKLVRKNIKQVKEQFQNWGILHFLARSGLHLVVCITLLQTLCLCIPAPYHYKQIFMLGVIFLYVLLSWTSISFIRAILISFFYIFCRLTRQNTHFLHLLFLSATIILLYNPYQIFFLDFQLSFYLTLAIALFNFRTVIPRSNID